MKKIIGWLGFEYNDETEEWVIKTNEGYISYSDKTFYIQEGIPKEKLSEFYKDVNSDISYEELESKYPNWSSKDNLVALSSLGYILYYYTQN